MNSKLQRRIVNIFTYLLLSLIILNHLPSAELI